MTVRTEIVALLGDCDLTTFSLDGTVVRHADGRPFSDSEMGLLDEVGREEITEAARRAGCGGYVLATIGDCGEAEVTRRRMAGMLPLITDAERAEYEWLEARMAFLRDQIAGARENWMKDPHPDPRGGD